MWAGDALGGLATAKSGSVLTLTLTSVSAERLGTFFCPAGIRRQGTTATNRMHPMDDASVIQRVLAGDTNAFRLLVERYQQPLFGLLRNLTRDRQECEDIAQEVFLAAYMHLCSFDARRSSFSAWLCTIARNKCVNAWKKHRPLVWAELPEETGPRLPESILGEEEFFRQLDAGLASLPPEQKTVFVLAELQGLPHEEIAHMEQVPLGTVKSRLSRAKAKLRSLLRHLLEQP